MPNYTEGTTQAAGGFRGRGIRADGTSGVDIFAGFNLTSIVVQVPKASIQGAGAIVNVWATVSQLVPTRHGQNTYTQIERQGQQAISTIFVTGGGAAPRRVQFRNSAERRGKLLLTHSRRTDNDGQRRYGEYDRWTRGGPHLAGSYGAPQRSSTPAALELWQYEQEPLAGLRCCRTCNG